MSVQLETKTQRSLRSSPLGGELNRVGTNYPILQNCARDLVGGALKQTQDPSKPRHPNVSVNPTTVQLAHLSQGERSTRAKQERRSQKKCRAKNAGFCWSEAKKESEHFSGEGGFRIAHTTPSPEILSIFFPATLQENRRISTSPLGRGGPSRTSTDQTETFTMCEAA